QITAYQSQNDQYIRVIKTLAHGQINEANKSLDLMKGTLQYLAQQQIKLASNQVESLMRETLLQNPRNVMSIRYGIVRRQHKAIRSVQQMSCDSIQIELQHGTIEANVTKVLSND